MAFPFYKQYDSMDCGPACLRMVAKYYGGNYSLQELRQQTQIGKEGVNLLGISEAASAIGFHAKAIKLDLISLTTKVWDCRFSIYNVRSTCKMKM